MGTARNLKLTSDPEPQKIDIGLIDLIPVRQDRNFTELMNSIEQLGMLQPPTLREPKSKTGKYEIIFGRRRIEAAVQLGYTDVNCLVYPKSVDKAFIPSATLAENRIRSSNIGSDILAVFKMVEQGYDDPEVISNMTGVSQAEAKELLSLTDMPTEILDGIIGGTIAPTTAKEVKKLRPKAMERALSVLDETGKLTANDIRKVREVQIDQAAAQVVLPDIPDIPELTDDEPVDATPSNPGLISQIIDILQGKGNDRTKIAAIRSLLGLDDEPVESPTIAQRNRVPADV